MEKMPNFIYFVVDSEVKTLEQLKARTEEFIKTIDNVIELMKDSNHNYELIYTAEESPDGNESAISFQIL